VPHVLISGRTESGKSTLARQIASLRKAQGRGVLVLDPVQDKPWQCDFLTMEQEEFLRVVWASQSCDVFVDEAGDMIGHYDKLMIQLASRGRHFQWREGVYGGGHNCYFIMQRPAMCSPTIRTQCKKLYAFQQDIEDAIALKKAWGHEELLQAPALGQGEYIYCERFHAMQRGRVLF